MLKEVEQLMRNLRFNNVFPLTIDLSFVQWQYHPAIYLLLEFLWNRGFLLLVELPQPNPV